MIRKIIYTVIGAAVLFSGCKKEEEGATLVVTPDSGVELIEMDDTALSGKVSFDQAGGAVTFQVQTNQASGWNFELDQEDNDWFQVGKQDGILTISAAENRALVERTQTVRVKAGTSQYMMTWVITVTQAPTVAASVKVNPAQLELSADGESVDITVTTDQKNWSVISPQSMWVKLIKDEDGGKFNVTVARNATSKTLKGVITLIVGEEDNSAQIDIPVTQWGQPPVKVTVTPTSIPFDTNGGVVDVTVTLENASTWQMQCQETWLKVERTPSGARVTVAPNYSSNSYSATLLIGAGDADNNDVKAIPITQPANPNAGAMILEYTLPENTVSQIGYWVALPFAKVGTFTVDWGDGSAVQTFSAAYPKHKYAKAGVYNVAISGVVTQISLNNLGVMKPDPSEPTNAAAFQERMAYLTAVKAWGNTGLTTLASAFSGNRNLQYVAPDTEGAFSKVASVSKMFEQKENKDYPPMGTLTIDPGLFKFIPTNVAPTQLFYYALTMTEIPEGILDPFAQTTTVEGCFYKAGISEVPESVFDKLTMLTSVKGVFQSCAGLKSVPGNLFANNKKLSTFDMAFHSSGMTTIPENLFANNTEATSFLQCFYNCTSLAAIPAKLFDNNKKVTSFQMTFGYCSAVTGESPYTLIDNQKVHLYERSNHPATFTPVTATTRCFQSCTKLSDYANIPSAWVQ